MSNLSRQHLTRQHLTRQHLSRLPLFAGGLGVLLLAAACGGSSTSVTASASGSTAAAKSAAATVVNAATTSAGKILVDDKGRTMYAFAADKKGHSSCTGTCLTYWPLVPAGAKAPTDGAGVTATFGVIKRADGTSQLTADGWPMYTYVGDSKPGATTGQGKNLSGGLWWVVDPTGKWITKAGAAAGSGTTSPALGGY
jgi:predicted lipoprotein with Yx(FWY)xxD motif